MFRFSENDVQNENVVDYFENAFVIFNEKEINDNNNNVAAVNENVIITKINEVRDEKDAE